MLPLSLDVGEGARPSVLVLGSHPDDIEIGCGGTLLRLAELHPEAEVCWVVLSGDPVRVSEARASAEAFLRGAARHRVIVQGFPDGFFPYEGAAVKAFFEELKRDVAPDVIFTHYRSDLHQDHRLVCDLTWNTFRDHLILEYEVPKYDGDFGVPNLFVPLPEPTVESKLTHLMEHFPSQHARPWFTRDLFTATMRVRGMECASPTRFAEAFYSRKAVLLGARP
jgi:LmbE family N-acetylglucosaminyl deacetylase